MCILKHSNITVSSNCNNILQYYCFCCIFDQIPLEHYFKNIKKIIQNPTFEQKCIFSCLQILYCRLNVFVIFPRCTGRQMNETDYKGPLHNYNTIKTSPTIYIDLRNNAFQTKQSVISQSNSVISPVNPDKKKSSTNKTSNTNARANGQKR